jgi:hypothetical protein
MEEVAIPPQKKSRLSLILLLLAFALPIILAKLALEQNWLDYGVTNKGTLVNNELSLKKLGLGDVDFEHNWLILYVLPKTCDVHCENTLENVHNTYVALGKEMPRVRPVALVQTQLSEQQSSRIKQSQWQVLNMPMQTKNIIDHAQVLLVDPLGNVFLTHKIPTNDQELSTFGKQILADMKKVLKYSRIG